MRSRFPPTTIPPRTAFPSLPSARAELRQIARDDARFFEKFAARGVIQILFEFDAPAWQCVASFEWRILSLHQKHVEIGSKRRSAQGVRIGRRALPACRRFRERFRLARRRIVPPRKHDYVASDRDLGPVTGRLM